MQLLVSLYKVTINTQPNLNTTMQDEPASSSWSMRGLKRWLSTAPETRDELIKLVQESRQFLEPETVDMLEGVLDLPATQVREIMTPRTQVVGIKDSDNLTDILELVLESSHSRYPVFDSKDTDAVVGILLAKDLLPYLAKQQLNKPIGEFNLKRLLRQPVYIAETARSDTLLRSLQHTQVHMAVVVDDDFGNTAGVVTLEDLLEEIVGDIVDEHDDLEDSDASYITPDNKHNRTWFIQAVTPIEFCNEALNTQFDDSEVDSMGGLVMQALGRVDNLTGQSVTIADWQFSIVETDGRMIQLLQAVAPPENVLTQDDE